MNQRADEALIERIRNLSPEQFVEVEDFVAYLTAKSNRRDALDKLLAIAPALEAAGVPAMTEEEVANEVNAMRAERRARLASESTPQDGDSDRT